jgi:hypothetical protein
MLRIDACFGRAAPVCLVAIGFIVGCSGGSSPPPASPEPSAPPPASERAAGPAASASAAPSASTDSAAASGSSAASVPSASAAPAAASVPTLVQLCEKSCEKVAKRCSETAIENCHMNCSQYEHPPAGCESEVRSALECAKDAEDVTCVNIAPESCAHKFRRVVACANGKPIAAKDEELTIPEGWDRYSSAAAGFATPMPKGVSETSEDGEPRFGVKQGDVSYVVRVMPAPKEKLTQKNLVFTTMKLVGKCQRNLKLYGLVERPERTFVRFDSKCPDNTDWHGALVIAGGKMYVPIAMVPKGGQGPIDPFLYGFEAGGSKP